jgi:predicted MFS family arabinose efflux permease
MKYRRALAGIVLGVIIATVVAIPLSNPFSDLAWWLAFLLITVGWYHKISIARKAGEIYQRRNIQNRLGSETE